MSAPAQLLLAKAKLTPQQQQHFAHPYSASAGQVSSAIPSAEHASPDLEASQPTGSEQPARNPSWVTRQPAQPPIVHVLGSSGQFKPKESPHMTSGPHKPAKRDMAVIGVLPQCIRYKFQEFSLSSHFTGSQVQVSPRPADTGDGTSTRETASIKTNRLPTIFLNFLPPYLSFD